MRGAAGDTAPQLAQRAPAASARRSKAVSRPRTSERVEPPEWALCAPACGRCGHRLTWRGLWACDGCASGAIGAAERMRRDQLPAAVCGACNAHAVTWRRERGRSVGYCAECGAVLDEAAYAPRLPAEPQGLTREAVSGAPLFSTYLLNNSASSPSASRNRERGRWLDELEILTSPHRQRRAAHHRLRAGFHWHRIRETGQGERFERVRTCGRAAHMLEGYDRQTGEVATSRPFEKRCGCWRVCDRCLGRRKRRLAEDVKRQRELALSARGWQSSTRYAGTEGRWSERLITLTVPHGVNAAEDAALLRKAWPELSRRLWAHLRKDRGVDGKLMPIWVRALEVAPGAAGGHAHLHIWWLGPFIDHAWLRVTFGRVLESLGAVLPRKSWNEVFHKPPSSNPRADARDWHGAIDRRAQRWCMTRRGVHGREEDSVPWPVVDVRSARDGGASAYANKVGVHLYVVKGHKGAISRLHPVHAAAVYQALEGARAVQWARGWAPQKIESDHVWRIRLMSDAELREWCHGGERPAWSDAKGAAEPQQSARVYEAQAPPVEALVAQFEIPF